MFKRITLALLFYLVPSVAMVAKTLYVRDYGIHNVNNRIDAYRILLKCHQDAVAKGCSISYKGIDNLYLELPNDVVTIPLPDITDFAGVTITVENRVKDIALFSRSNRRMPVTVNKEEIDNGLFCEESLKKNVVILTISDAKPWVRNRKGTSEKVNRRDVLLLEDGQTDMRPICPYNNVDSSPICDFFPVNKLRKEFKNLRFVRTANSNHITALIKISGENNVIIKNIRTKTPDNDHIYADGIFSIDNSVNITLDDLTIDETYSQRDKFGYGIIVNTVYNLKLKNVRAKTKWGAFCSSNLQNLKVENCDINRIDLHCYGKNFECNNCNFVGRDIPFASFFGTVKFVKCQFSQGLPLYLRQEYNANTPFHVIWEKCIFNFPKRANSLIGVNGLSKERPSRSELAHKNLPNITIKDCYINLSENYNNWNLIKTGDVEWVEPIWNLTEIRIDGLEINKEATMELFTTPVVTKDTLRVTIKRIYEIKNGKRCRLKVNNLTAGERTIITCDGQPVVANTIHNKRRDDSVINGGIGALIVLTLSAWLSIRNKRCG